VARRRNFLLLLILCITLTVPLRASPESNNCRIGVIAPLTGGMAGMGNALRNGIELARKEQGQRLASCRFFFEDDQYDGKRALAAYEKLRLERVQILFGFGSIVAQAVGPLAERDRLVLLNFGFEAGPAVGKNWLIRTLNHSGQYQQVMAAYLEKTIAHEIPIIRTELSFLNSMTESLRGALNARQRLFDMGVVLPGDNDFRALALKTKTLKPSHVGLYLLPEQLISFAKYARSLGWAPIYFGTDMFESASGLVRGEKLFEGSIYPDNAAALDFRQRYRAAFGNEDQLTFAANAYDMTALVATSLVDTQENDKSVNLLQVLRAVRMREGVLGRFSYTADPGYGQFFEYPVTIKQIINDRGVPIAQEKKVE
jgi:branched-chain amino acid transport system substrate-binding protein